MSPNEVWKPIYGYTGFYEVSNLGRIKSTYQGGRILSPRKAGSNYRKVTLCKNSKHKDFYIHRLVLKTFKPSKIKLEVNHINGVKSDNRLTNLEWVTPKQNSRHSREILLKNVGTKHGHCKLTESQVREIRKSSLSNSKLAQKYKISSSQVQRIKTFKRWTHLV